MSTFHEQVRVGLGKSGSTMSHVYFKKVRPGGEACSAHQPHIHEWTCGTWRDFGAVRVAHHVGETPHQILSRRSISVQKVSTRAVKANQAARESRNQWASGCSRRTKVDDSDPSCGRKQKYGGGLVRNKIERSTGPGCRSQQKRINIMRHHDHRRAAQPSRECIGQT